MTGDKIEIKAADGTVLAVRTELAPGGPHKYDYDYVGPEGGGHVLTGPAAGSVRLSDGTVYDVTPDVVAHLPGHAGPLVHHIERMHELAGGLPVGKDGARVPFRHVCTDFCGAEQIPS
jgi:hypothetical protein